MSATSTSLEELLQCEEDSFIPDELDDKLYNDHTYNWEVMFETVKLFLMKEGRWPRCEREEDKRNVIMADGSVVLRDLAMWMCTQRQIKFKGKLLEERERKLDSIRFMWDRWEHEWHAMFYAAKRFKDKEGRWPREKKAEDKREVVLADGKPVLRDLARWMNTQKAAQSNGKLIPLREEKLNSIGFVWSEKEHNWEVMLAAVKSFKEKEGRWPRCDKAEDKREVVLADGKPVLRDLALWMQNQKKRRDKLDLLREEMLKEIDFPFHNRKKRKRQADASSSSSTTSRKKKRTISDYL